MRRTVFAAPLALGLVLGLGGCGDREEAVVAPVAGPDVAVAPSGPTDTYDAGGAAVPPGMPSTAVPDLATTPETREDLGTTAPDTSTEGASTTGTATGSGTQPPSQ